MFTDCNFFLFNTVGLSGHHSNTLLCNSACHVEASLWEEGAVGSRLPEESSSRVGMSLAPLFSSLDINSVFASPTADVISYPEILSSTNKPTAPWSSKRCAAVISVFFYTWFRKSSTWLTLMQIIDLYISSCLVSPFPVSKTAPLHSALEMWDLLKLRLTY